MLVIHGINLSTGRYLVYYLGPLETGPQTCKIGVITAIILYNIAH